MPYYLTIIQRFVDGSPEAKALFEYGTLNDAVVAFYNNMSSSAANENIASVTCVILNGYGLTERKDYWARPIPEPDPEPTPDPEPDPEPEITT